MAQTVCSGPDQLPGQLVDHAEPGAESPPEPEDPEGESSSREVPVCELLEVDREYRLKAAAGTLHRIAPRRHDPWKKGWLPVLHTYRGKRQYTAMFAITPRAHQLGMTHDWVILYYDGDQRQSLATVITSRFGPLRGHRLVRGREVECIRYYAEAHLAGRECLL